MPRVDIYVWVLAAVELDCSRQDKAIHRAPQIVIIEVAANHTLDISLLIGHVAWCRSPKVVVIGRSHVIIRAIQSNDEVLRKYAELVIRINDVGRAEAVAYETFTYAPQEPEIKYFLIQFVTRYYSRMRATVRETYASSLSTRGASDGR